MKVPATIHALACLTAAAIFVTPAEVRANAKEESIYGYLMVDRYGIDFPF